MSAKRYNLIIIITLLIILTIISTISIYTDPFFHYHAPIAGKAYPLNAERYQNNGIVKHFSYEAIITGTSMCDNFKVSECEELFGYSTIKVPFSAGSYYEVARNLKNGLSSNSNIKLVIRSLDLWGGEYILSDKNALEPAFTYPNYLYDNNLFNDTNYFLSKDTLIRSTSILFNSHQNPITDFDNYSNWMNGAQFGKEHVLSVFSRSDVTASPLYLDDNQKNK